MSIREIRLPELGEGVTEGEMVRWLVKEGDKVEVDQAVAEMMTDKATVEVPVPFSGQIQKLKVKEGDIVPIKNVILVMDVSESKEKISKTEVIEMKEEEISSFSNSNTTKNVEPEENNIQSRILAAPHTRKLARELNVDLRQVKGTGLSGRIRREDVLQQAGEGEKEGGVTLKRAQASFENEQTVFNKESLFPPLSSNEDLSLSTSDREKRVPLRGVRRKISTHMKESKSRIPHFTLVEEAFVSELIQLRKKVQPRALKQNIKLTYLPFIIKALIQTLKEYPIFNACLDEQNNEIVYKNYFNIGLAVSTNEGLMVPNIKAADKKSILQLAYEIQSLALKARQSKLSLDELKDGTFTISNIGSVGGLFATPIIYHPEVAILGMYKIEDKIILSQNKEEKDESFFGSPLSEVKIKKKNLNVNLYVKKCMNFSITCDHRLIDGAVAAEFLNSFVSRIETPGLLLLEMT